MIKINILWLILCCSYLAGGAEMQTPPPEDTQPKIRATKLNDSIRDIERGLSRRYRDLKGSLEIALTVAPSGDIADIKVISNQLNDPRREKEIIDEFKPLRIQNNTQGDLILNLPIIFE